MRVLQCMIIVEHLLQQQVHTAEASSICFLGHPHPRVVGFLCHLHLDSARN
jgi:hypothetical protein